MSDAAKAGSTCKHCGEVLILPMNQLRSDLERESVHCVRCGRLHRSVC